MNLYHIEIVIIIMIRNVLYSCTISFNSKGYNIWHNI